MTSRICYRHRADPPSVITNCDATPGAGWLAVGQNVLPGEGGKLREAPAQPILPGASAKEDQCKGTKCGTRSIFIRSSLDFEILGALRQPVAFPGKPNVQRRQDKNAQCEIDDQASDNDDRKGPLRIGADGM